MAAIVMRPGLWFAALRQLRALTPRGRRLGPDPAYARFRALTQYGDEAHPFAPADVVGYLEWSRRFSRPRLRPGK